MVGHAALLAVLTLGLAQMARPPAPAAPMEVSFVEDVGLVAAAPEPTPEPQAQGTAPEVGPVEDAAPAPAPEPAPAPPAPRESRPARAAPARAQGAAAPGPAGHGRHRRAHPPSRPRRSQSATASAATPASRSNRPPAAAMSAQAAADIGSAITRQVQPCADRQVDPGPGADRIVTTLNLRLNRDGSLAAAAARGRQSGLNDDNRRYAERVADLAVASFVGCSPLRGLPAELYDVPRGWSNFTMNYRLPG